MLATLGLCCWFMTDRNLYLLRLVPGSRHLIQECVEYNHRMVDIRKSGFLLECGVKSRDTDNTTVKLLSGIAWLLLPGLLLPG